MINKDPDKSNRLAWETLPLDSKIFGQGNANEIASMASKLHISAQQSHEMDKALQPIRDKNTADTYWIPLRNSFFTKNEYDIPVPFVKLWQTLSDEEDAANFGLASPFFGVPDLATVSAGLFWRFYACYRYGLDWNITLQQLNQGIRDQGVMELWRRELKLLYRRLIPYVIVNRFIIMPINRLVYKFSR